MNAIGKYHIPDCELNAGNKKGAITIGDTDSTNPTGTTSDDDVATAIKNAFGPDVTVLNRIITGGPDNSPTSSTETEDMIQITFPASETDNIAAIIASNSSKLAQNKITAASITPFPCFASPSGFCAPGQHILPPGNHCSSHILMPAQHRL